MQLIQNGSQGSPSIPAKQAAVGTPGYGYGGPPGSTPSSIWDPDVANTILAELINILIAAGIAIDPTDNGQVLKALRKIGFPTGLGLLSTSTTLTAAAAGNFYNVGGSATTQALNTATFTAGQTIGFLAQSACTITTSSGVFYGGSLSGASFVMGVGSLVALEWDGLNWRQIAGSFSAGRLIGYQVFTNSGTYTPTPGMATAVVEVQAGGGAGGGAPAAGGGLISLGSGGGAGAYGKGVYAAAQIGTSQAVTVGAGGTPASGTFGGNGGASSFGALLTAPPGPGGAVAGPTAAPWDVGGAGSSAASGTTGTIIAGSGAAGPISIALNTTAGFGAPGAASNLGAGAPSVGSAANGANAGKPGAGGGGTFTPASGTALTGGQGAGGIVIVWEYS